MNAHTPAHLSGLLKVYIVLLGTSNKLLVVNFGVAHPAIRVVVLLNDQRLPQREKPKHTRQNFIQLPSEIHKQSQRIETRERLHSHYWVRRKRNQTRDAAEMLLSNFAMGFDSVSQLALLHARKASPLTVEARTARVGVVLHASDQNVSSFRAILRYDMVQIQSDVTYSYSYITNYKNITYNIFIAILYI